MLKKLKFYSCKRNIFTDYYCKLTVQCNKYMAKVSFYSFRVFQQRPWECIVKLFMAIISGFL